MHGSLLPIKTWFLALLIVASFVLMSCALIQTKSAPPSSEEKFIPKTASASKIIVVTDRREYQQGDVITILVLNETDNSIWFSANERFWTLERLSPNNQWLEVNFSFPLPDSHSGAQSCIFTVYEQPYPSELKSQEELRAIWPLKEICEWPLEPVGVPTAEPKLIASGVYRIVFTYGLSDNYEALSKGKAYSDPFVIK
ncbi:MAG: hypothetical protein QXS54_06295 [Candidatus Methanomethylicaceae archaeon]